MRMCVRLDPAVSAVLLGIGSLVAAPLAGAQTTKPGEVLAPETRPPELRPSEAAADVGMPPRAAAPRAGSAAKVTVRQFEFEGNSLFGTDALQPLVDGYLDRPITLLDIYEAADKVAAFYVDQGYTLASVNVPPQQVSGGVVRLVISEGQIAQVTAEGNSSYRTRQLAAYLPSVDSGTVYRAGSVDQGLRTLNTLPGLKARAVIKPGEAYGTSDLVLKVEEDRVSGLVAVDNYGRDSIGEFRATGFVQVNNPLRVADQLQLLALVSEDGLLNYGYGAYSVPVTNRGTRLSLSYGHADFEVRDTPVDGRNRSGRVQLDHPFLRSARNVLTGSIGASRTLSNADFGGATFNDTSITLAELGVSYTHTYPGFAVTQVSTNLASNFDRATRADLNPPSGSVRADQRLRWELDVQHLQPVADLFQILLHANGVYSPDPLASPQQYSLGGPTTIRGYAPAEIRGDRGYFGSVEVRKSFAFGDFRLSPRVFADAGKVMLVDALPGSNEEETLTSAGIGTDASYRWLTLKLDWAFPLDQHPASDGRDDSRLYGSFSVKF